MPGKVILTADDFGACEFIDKGISRAISNGHINTVSAFVTHVRSEKCTRELVELRKSSTIKNVNIGLHFSITSGYSLQAGSNTLTKELKEGKYYFKTANYYNFGDVNQDHLRDEIIAQLNQLDSWLGEIKIDHVAVHHGITYLDPIFFQTFIDTISKYKGQSGKYKDRSIPIRSPRSWYASHDVKNCCYDPESNQKIIFPGIGTLGFA